MKKRGFELSINVLIVVILSIFLLFLGFNFFRNLLTGATKIKDDYDQRTEEELENLLMQGQKIAIPFPKQDIKKTDTHVFGLGIYNAIGHSSYFKVNVQCSTAYKGKVEYSSYCDVFSGGANIVYKKNDILIRNNERHKMAIGITVPNNAQIASYVFNVCVCYDEINPIVSCTDCGPSSFPANLYESIHKIYANVK